jgi:hypothetical protein
MNMRNRKGTMLAACGLVVGLMVGNSVAYAQDVTPEQLALAKSAVSAIGATDAYDNILLEAAEALKVQLIQKDPNLESLVVQTVDETALALASRRSDLEAEAGRIYAKNFDNAELQSIIDFYSSPVGQKLQGQAPILVREVGNAANVWQNGVARDLAQQVGDKLSAAVKASAPADGAAKPEGEQPAKP